MINRRKFLASSGGTLAILATGWARREVDSTWLVYAPNAELYWSKLPFLDRLRKISEAGFTRYEFGRWKTKDTGAIAKLNEELGLQAMLFTAYPGLRGTKWKEGMLEAATDASELAPTLGVLKVSVIPPERDVKIDREDQVDDLVDALKEAVEKVAESEVVLILEPVKPVAKGPISLIATVEEAAAVVKAVNSERVKFAFPIEKGDVEGGKLPALIETLKGQAGYYRLNDFVPTTGSEEKLARVLKAIHTSGYLDPIGLGLVSKGDPLVAIESIRKIDAAAKAL